MSASLRQHEARSHTRASSLPRTRIDMARHVEARPPPPSTNVSLSFESTMRPRSMKAMWSEICSTSSVLCEEQRIERPSSFSTSICSAVTSCRATGSRPDVSSSSTSSRGLRASARSSKALTCSPRDSPLIFCRGAGKSAGAAFSRSGRPIPDSSTHEVHVPREYRTLPPAQLPPLHSLRRGKAQPAVHDGVDVAVRGVCRDTRRAHELTGFGHRERGSQSRHVPAGCARQRMKSGWGVLCRGAGPPPAGQRCESASLRSTGAAWARTRYMLEDRPPLQQDPGNPCRRPVPVLAPAKTHTVAVYPAQTGGRARWKPADG
jgi:hypothetical protein